MSDIFNQKQEPYPFKEQQRWVREKRMDLGLTQRQLAMSLLSQFGEEANPLLSAHVRIGEIERGHRKITAEERKAISGFFHDVAFALNC